MSHAAPATSATSGASPSWPAGLALTLNALVWGLSWWPFRWLQERGLHPLWATAFIYFVCVVVVGLWQRQVWGELRRHPALWVIALGSGLTNASFNWAVTMGDVLRVVLLFYLMPLWAVILARWLLHERLTPLALLRVVLAMLGAAIVLGASPGRLPLPSSLIEWLAVLGGFSFALNNVMLRREAARSEASRTVAMFIGGTLLSAAAALVLQPLGMVPWPRLESGLATGLLLLLACAFLAANMALQYGASRLPANATAVIMLTEVFFAGFSAWLLGAASLEPRVLIGGAMILGAAALAALAAR